MATRKPKLRHTEVTAENLQEIREFYGLSQERLAALVWLTNDKICKIEAGTRKLSAAEKFVLDVHFFNKQPTQNKQ